MPLAITRRRADIFNVVKITGALMVIVGGIAAAYMLNARAKSSLAHTEGVISLVKHIRRSIDCYSMPAERIFSDCDSRIYAECGYFGNEVPRSLSELMSGCDALDARLLDILGRFEAEFGKSYRDEQVRICDRYIDELDEVRRGISERLPIRKRLNSTLCISGAIAIVILFV